VSLGLGIAAGAVAVAFAVLGWLGARSLDRRPVRPKPSFSWAIVPLAVLVGAGAGYGAGVAADAEDVGTVTGAVVGLALGLASLVLWLRAHPRVRGTGGAYKLTGIPTSALDDITDEAAEGLLRRWLTLSTGSLVRVAIVPASADLADLAGDTAAWLHGLQAEASGGNRLNGSAPEQEAPVEAVPAHAGDPLAAPRPQWRSRWSPKGPRPAATAPAEGHTNGAAERVEPKPAPRLVMLATGLADPELLEEDLVVMLAQDGMMSHDLSERADRLENLGCRPEWMLLVRSPAAVRKHVGRRAENGSAPE